MRISLNWLKDYISLPFSHSELAKILTMAGLEVDGWESIAENTRDILVASVVETRKHPDADKLCVATVFDGKNTWQVVCGASNCRAGIKTAFAPIGAKLKDGEGEFTIKKAKLRGVESSGMLCSAKELGISEEDDGIMELPSDYIEGTRLANYYADTIFEISLTPNLNYCASVRGVARELAAFTKEKATFPQSKFQESHAPISDMISVAVQNPLQCPRYSCRVIKNVQVGPSPSWLKKRLEAAGLKSINNIVDVTNYVLFETGQPLHAFDYARIEGNQLIVRQAKEGETIQTLDGKTRLLKETMCVICDQNKPLALAGVMGGLNSEVNLQTTTIVLESAYFNASDIRRASKQVGLSTDASKRFERGSDPNNLLLSLDRAAELIQQVAGGEILKGIIEVKSQEFSEKQLICRLKRINQILGLTLSQGEVESIFDRLQFHHQWDDGHQQFTLSIPTYRVDISGEIDLIEEVARLYGYENIPRTGGYFQVSSMPSSPLYLFEKQMRTRLIAEGLQEFLTCDLIGPSLLSLIDEKLIESESLVKVLNPVSIEQSVLRQSLLPGLLQVVRHNYLHQCQTIAGFEIGGVYFKQEEHYNEQPVLALILTGKTSSDHWDIKTKDYDFYDLKGIIENVLEQLGIKDISYQNLGLKTFHTGRQASLFSGSLEIGTMGEIHPAIQRRLDISQRILFAEISLYDLMKIMQPMQKITPLAIYPSSERDWTCTIKQNVTFDKILQLVKECSPKMLEKVSVKGIYKNEKLGHDYHNLTLNFVYRDRNKTVAQEDVDSQHQELTKNIQQMLGDAIK